MPKPSVSWNLVSVFITCHVSFWGRSSRLAIAEKPLYFPLRVFFSWVIFIYSTIQLLHCFTHENYSMYLHTLPSSSHLDSPGAPGSSSPLYIFICYAAFHFTYLLVSYVCVSFCQQSLVTILNESCTTYPNPCMSAELQRDLISCMCFLYSIVDLTSVLSLLYVYKIRYYFNLFLGNAFWVQLWELKCVWIHHVSDHI